MTDSGGVEGSTLVIVGDTLHHLDSSGRLWTHAALAAQLDLWAEHFDYVRFCGVLAQGLPPPGFGHYGATNIRLVPIPKAGGVGLRAKLSVVRTTAAWLKVLVPSIRAADAVHLRTPCNVTILGILLARLLVQNRYAIFAGSWDAYAGEPWSYRIQRWMLRRWFGGTVHAYIPPSVRPDRPNVRPAFSPVLSDERLADLQRATTRVRAAESYPGGRPLKVVSVGRFSPNKNQVTLVGAVRAARAAGVGIQCRLIGDGSSAEAVRAAASDLSEVTFTAHADRAEVFAAMQWADLNVLPSFREGYPKVLLEGMSAGALPVASDTPMNRAMVEERGWLFDPHDPAALARVFETASRISSREWDERRAGCATYARRHTLDAFAVEVDHIARSIWQINQRGNPDEQPPRDVVDNRW